jgi:hypothetical protein
VILIPGKDLERFSIASALIRPSATGRKSRGEIGQPFLKPLYDLKKGDVEPFMSIEKETVVM